MTITIKKDKFISNPQTSQHRPWHVIAPIPGVVYPKQSELNRYVEEGVLGFDTLVDGFRDIVRQYPDNVALLGPELHITYLELDELSSRLAAALLKQGLQPLDRAVFQLRDSEQLIIAFLACLKAGIIPICTLAAHREREIGYLAEFAEAKLHIVQGDDLKFDSIGFARKMQEAVPTLNLIMQVAGEPLDGILHQDMLIADIELAEAEAILQSVELDPFQVAVFQLSGGTTGVSKIIPRFHNEYLYNMRAVATWLEYKSDDVMFMPLPMVHNLNMGCCFGPFLMTGGTVTVAPDLRPESLISLIAMSKPTWLGLSGPIIARVEAAIHDGQIDLSYARGIVVPGEPAKMQALLNVLTYTIFGMTEGVIMYTHKDDSDEAKATTHGRPVSAWDDIRILVPGTEQDVEPGEVGEPAFKGPYTIHGYYRAEERNREAFTSDGYYRSGDLMHTKVIDGKNYYVFCGRIKDLVSRGGEKINCDEVEHAVASHPSVAAVMTVDYPCPVLGERLCAFLLLREGKSAPSVAEMGVFLQEYGLAKFKWPERIEVLEAFPLTASGKPSREKLRELVKVNVEQERAALANSSKHSGV